MATPKKTPAKKEAQSQKTPDTKTQEKDSSKTSEQPQNEFTSVENEKRSENKSRRVITLLSSDDSKLLSQFALPRSAISRAVIRGTQDFLKQFAAKKDVTEQEIVSALQDKLK
jgi:hypothetical protein